MSLIHEALKKVEKKDASAMSRMPPIEPFEEKRPPSNKRKLMLIVLLVGASIFAIYMNFFSGPSKSSPKPGAASSPKAAAASAGSAEVARLKTSAEQYYASGEYDQAQAMWLATRDVQPNDPEVLNNLGMVAKRRGELNKATELFEQALSINPSCFECLNNAASVDLERGDIEKAKTRLLRVLDLNPSYPEANFHLALISEQEGKMQEAVKYYIAFVRSAQDVPPQFLEQVRTHVIEIQE